MLFLYTGNGGNSILRKLTEWRRCSFGNGVCTAVEIL